MKAGFATGIIAQHRAVLNQLIKGYPKAMEVNVLKDTDGSRYWHYENNYPKIGIHFSATDYANINNLGWALALAPFAEIPLRERKSSLHMRICWGAAWLTKKFDIHRNQKNIAIGSHLNHYIQFRWFWKIPVSNKVIFEPGFMAMHVSNARFQSPNLGLNILSLQSVLHFGTNEHLPKTIPLVPEFFRKEFFLVQTVGINDYEVYGKKLFSFGTQLQYHFLNKPKHRWMAGTDFYYDQNYLTNVEYYAKVPDNTLKKFRFGPKIGYAYNLGRISFPIEMGYYLYQITNPDGNFFHRIGMRYYFSNGIIINATLRSHFAVAYCFELGAGYVIKYSKK
ncbi:MAG: acyloxyacyl hydrolase [Bacteroidia bacterium]|nr:acyloxyacyl hydrolase [Bacteroidia bacterium]